MSFGFWNIISVISKDVGLARRPAVPSDTLWIILEGIWKHHFGALRHLSSHGWVAILAA